MLKFIDVHAHLNFPQFETDREAVFRRAKEAGVGVINVGTDIATSELAVALAEMRDNVWATVGLHPTDLPLPGEQEVVLANLEKLALNQKTVAIGECGLDYFRVEPSHAGRQKEIFIKQIELANKLNKPLMLHIRNAYQDAYEILKIHTKVPGNAHFFAGNWNEAQKFLSLGFTLSFGGVITFVRDYDEVIKNTPLEMILAETDCPFVAPIPHRGERNEPLYIREIVRKIAEIKGLNYDLAAETLLQNARRVFLA